MTNQSAPTNPQKSGKLPRRQVKAQHEEARIESIAADYLANCTPEQRRIQEKLRAFELQPKTVPPFRSLRECIVSTLSCAEMKLLLESESEMTEASIDAFHKLLAFNLWDAYRKDIKNIPNSRVNTYYDIAATSRDPQCRSSLKHVAVVMAIRYLVADPSLVAEREHFELNLSIESKALDQSKKSSHRL